MSDISAIKPLERIVDMKHPSGSGLLGVRVKIMSVDDERMKRARRKIEDRRLQLAKKAKTFTADEIDENKNFIYFTAMTGWEWDDGVTFHDEVPEFTLANVHAVFNELPWFRDQIENELGETEAFFQK